MTLVKDVAQAHNLAIVEEWVRRLESGDYPQGYGLLRGATTLEKLYSISTSQFCCLGVGCEVLRDLGLAEREINWSGTDIMMRYRAKNVTHQDDWHSAILSDDLLRSLGGMSEELADHLSRMNDGQQNDFRSIASYLRSVYQL